ncbi:hypothetical protein NQ318_006832 [Aromia moschata]|uniref:C2H2-type domain-containing protein n=1 Tax=Aromia moschata TaxID=1265417 RepID=A0AAV8XR09_9CUCU|nr:hypothetical protein NQ318_006832 [Aromia moschata]
MDESMKKVIDESLYACSVCSKKFTSYFEYQDHQLSHDGELVFSCSKCNKVFCKRDELAEHNRNHKVHCNLRNVKVLPDSLASHLQKHSDSRGCCDYNNGHTSKAAQEEYFKLRHAGIKAFACDICGKRVNCESSMDRHMAYHHSARPYRCKFCNFSSKSISILNVHTSRMHETKRCVCELCFKWFKSELSLKQHMKRMHSPKNYICDVCGKGYMNKSNLKTHIMKKHTRETLYDCSTCGRDFFTMKELKEHMRIHKGGCLSCPKCGREFFYKKHLERHMLTCAPRDKHRKIACWRLKSSASLPNSSLGSFM